MDLFWRCFQQVIGCRPLVAMQEQQNKDEGWEEAQDDGNSFHCCPRANNPFTTIEPSPAVLETKSLEWTCLVCWWI